VQQLIAKGAVNLPQAVSDALWNQGHPSYNAGSGGGGIYRGTSSDPAYAFECAQYGTCNAAGMIVNVPSGAIVQASSDHHITVSDQPLAGEVDGWGGGSGNCSVGNGTVNCSWGGFFPFSGNGLDKGSSSDNAGIAMGLFTINAQETEIGEIRHALAWNVECLDNPGVYPALHALGNMTDGACHAGAEDGGSSEPAYGDLWVLNLTPTQIAALGYSRPCVTILTALATYGGYLVDTGNEGLGAEIEDGSSYNIYSNGNPWFSIIYPQMTAAGDGNGSGVGFTWQSCLQRLSASDFSMYQIASGS
jgi:hypothetical protein